MEIYLCLQANRAPREIPVPSVRGAWIFETDMKLHIGGRVV